MPLELGYEVRGTTDVVRGTDILGEELSHYQELWAEVNRGDQVMR